MLINNNSCLHNQWYASIDRSASAYALELSQKTGISILLAQLLVARGIDELTLPFYLEPKLRDLMPNPARFTDLDKAAKRIITSIKNKENICVYGDYDVDGAASSAIMAKFLRQLGAQVKIFIPHRIHDGYGLGNDRLLELKKQKIDLIIAVDCGSNDVIDTDIDIIIFDHHKIDTINESAYALVNPHRAEASREFTYLCAAGVVFIAIAYISSLLRAEKQYSPPNIMQYLDLVALATICDVVPLCGLNRAFILSGLKVAGQLQNIGLVMLMRALNILEPLNVYLAAYRIGPHINAAGRINDPSIGAELLCATQSVKAEKLAASLLHINKERQQIEEQGLESIIFNLHEKYSAAPLPPIILEIGSWHHGIIGLLAARVKEKYIRPAIIFTKQENGLAIGSARSISSVDIGALIHEAKELGLIEKGGGHAMAAGLTIKHEKFDAFANWIKQKLAKKMQAMPEKPSLKIELTLDVNALTKDLYYEIEKAGPYGSGNPRPLILFKQVYVKFAKIVGEKHVTLSLRSEHGYKKAIAFSAMAAELGPFLLDNVNSYRDLVGYVNLNYYRNNIEPQLQIIDAV